MSVELQILTAVFLCLLFGDLRGGSRPSTWIRRLARTLEPPARKMIRSPREAGALATLLVIVFSGIPAWALLRLAADFHPWAYAALSIWFFYGALSVRTLADRNGEVARALEVGNLVLARKRASEMTRRETESIEADETARIAVESVARHSVDASLAPLLCSFLFGPLGVLLYQAIDWTGAVYDRREEKYYDFGRVPERLERMANWIPSLVTVGFIALSAMLLGMRPFSALHAARRDGSAHESPTAGRPEAAMAGALGVQLGGPVYRDGVLGPLPFLGDPVEPIQPKHLRQANAILFAMTILAATVFALLHKWLT